MLKVFRMEEDNEKQKEDLAKDQMTSTNRSETFYLLGY